MHKLWTSVPWAVPDGKDAPPPMLRLAVNSSRIRLRIGSAKGRVGSRFWDVRPRSEKRSVGSTSFTRSAVCRMDNRGSGLPPDQEKAEDLFGRLYERYAPAIAKFFANRRFPVADVQDLTQETFLSAFRSWKCLRHPEKFEAWLFKIASNKWRNACRDLSTARRYIPGVALDPRLEAGKEVSALEERRQGGNPLREALVDEQHRLLRDALADLSPLLRNVVLMRLDQDLSYEEIATALRIPLGTVKSRINSATRQLEDLLKATHDQ